MKYFVVDVFTDTVFSGNQAGVRLLDEWPEVLGKKEMTARQLSLRKGRISCMDCEKRVKIGGEAVLYMRGEIECV